MTDASFHLPLAQAAEAAGYSSITVADSLAYPEVSDSTYPYTPDGSRTFRDRLSGPAADAVALGRELARRMQAAGAEQLLEQMRQDAAAAS